VSPSQLAYNGLLFGLPVAGLHPAVQLPFFFPFGQYLSAISRWTLELAATGERVFINACVTS
jgi:hypothetical protein